MAKMSDLVFDSYSKYYQLLYKDKDYKAEADYIHKLLENIHPGTKSILELGCGSGNHAQLLGNAGYAVHGIDVSRTMIEQAHFKAGKNVSFELGDVRSYRSDKVYDALISLFHVASYQVTNKDFEKYLQTAAIHLKTGGVFVFDFWYGPAVLTDLPSERKKVMEDSETKVTRLSFPEMFVNQNLCKVHFDVQVFDKLKKQTHEIKETHPMRYFFLPELDYMLSNSGFQIMKAYQWMTTKIPDFKSWNVVVVVKKMKPKNKLPI
jgi:SAM-dependent methyltransferase